MACFVVPAAEAVVVTAAVLILRAQAKKTYSLKECDGAALVSADKKLSIAKKLTLLTALLWGGSFLLAFEHLWHGEITPFFPFLTAAADAASATVMLSEMATVGVAMAVAVTGVWAIIVAVGVRMDKKTAVSATGN